jgi:hypothetical protein
MFLKAIWEAMMDISNNNKYPKWLIFAGDTKKRPKTIMMDMIRYKKLKSTKLRKILRERLRKTRMSLISFITVTSS